ncbi:MAG: PAS domain-containing protein [Cyanobacteria bacterium SZAS-4]|nr:PAS domain-containing protein [Cyanobacteria bacterium SZAS-4]
MSFGKRIKSRALDTSVLAQALEATKCGVLLTNPTQPDNPIIYANPSFCEMTGYSLDDIVGKNCRFLQGEDRKQPELLTVRSAIQNSESCTVVLRNYKKDGQLFFNELTITPVFNDAGAVSYFVGIQKDVTADVLLRKQQDEFVALLLHDLKTPLLAAVRLLDYVLQKTDLQSKDARSVLSNVVQNDQSLIRLLETAIDCFRPDNIVVNPGYFSLSSELQKSLSKLDSIAEQKNITVVIEDTSVTMCADPLLCTRLFTNLIELAIKYAPSGGRIAIKVNEKRGLDIVLSTRSSLFPVEFLRSNFELSLSSDEENATALTLFFSKKILEKHGGDLRINRLNKVTTITAHFPAAVISSH